MSLDHQANSFKYMADSLDYEYQEQSTENYDNILQALSDADIELTKLVAELKTILAAT